MAESFYCQHCGAASRATCDCTVSFLVRRLNERAEYDCVDWEAAWRAASDQAKEYIEKHAEERKARKEADATIARLRADVARLTGERDEARDGVMGLLPSMARRRGMSTADALEYLAAYTSDWRDYALEWMPLAARTQQAEAERDALRARVKAALDLVAEAEREGQTDDPNVYGIGQAWFDDLRAALAPEQEAQRPGSTSSGAELRDMLQAAEQGLEEMNRQLGIRNAPEQEAQHGE